MQNLFDLTGGNYKVHRVVTYPEFKESRLVFDADIRAVSDEEWSTEIAIDGRYDGPTDVIGVAEYEIIWRVEGNTLLEEGKANLVLKRGGVVKTKWTSEINPTKQELPEFPRSGEHVRVSYSQFDIDKESMSYEWEGTVEELKR